LLTILLAKNEKAPPITNVIPKKSPATSSEMESVAKASQRDPKPEKTTWKPTVAVTTTG